MKHDNKMKDLGTMILSGLAIGIGLGLAAPVVSYLGGMISRKD
jgi:hypothetical protein